LKYKFNINGKEKYFSNKKTKRNNLNQKEKRKDDNLNLNMS
jgi:YHS domain-containing protein